MTTSGPDGEHGRRPDFSEFGYGADGPMVLASEESSARSLLGKDLEMPPRKRTPRSPAAAATPITGIEAPDRFLGAAAGLEGLVEPADDSLVFQVIRPADLVALTVRATSCTLVKQDRTPYLEAGADALLIVSYPFQHALEEAQFEQGAPQPDKYGAPQPVGDLPDDPAIPVTQPAGTVGFIPARTSRLAFEVPEGDRIEFSSQGVLDAMTRLRMRVHRLAVPGPVPDVRGTAPGGGGGLVLTPPVIHLGDGLVLEVLGDSLRITSPSRSFFRSNPAPDTRTAAGAALAARELQRARELLATRPAVIAPRTRIPATSEFRPGGPWIPEIVGPFRHLRGKSSRPEETETAIEAPYRLVISPSNVARWAHAVRPVRNPSVPGHVELWHSRLAGPPLPDLPWRPEHHGPARPGAQNNEKDAAARVLRAIWARDRDPVADWWQPDTDGVPVAGLDHSDDPFIASLDRADRHMLVRQTSETWEGAAAAGKIAPTPFTADALWLSGLGAWLDLHGAWNTKPYSQQALSSIMVWDHVAPMGRDQFVRVVYPGYLFPFGHQAALVKVTERKMKNPHDSVASLYQRMFIVIGERSRSYGLADAEQRQFPFDRVDLRPLVTPPIDRPSPIGDISRFFWPKIGGQEFRFVIDAWDREGRPVRMATPLLWVSEAFQKFGDVQDAYAKSPHRRVQAYGQPVSFVRRDDDPDTDLQTESIYLLGRAKVGDSVPRMSSATVQVPAVQRLNPQDAAMPIRYFDKYLAEGLAPDQPGRVWAVTLGPGVAAETAGATPDPVLPTVPGMGFGQGGASSDRTGGFVAPSLPLAALARDRGPVGDPAQVASNTFDPKQFLAGVDAKLFGIVDLWDLIPSGLLDQAPTFVTETLGRIEAFLETLQRLESAVEEAKLQAELMASRLAADAQQALVDRANDAATKATKLEADATALVTEARTLIKVPGSPLVGLDAAGTAAKLASLKTMLDKVVADLDELGGLLPPQAAQLARTLSAALQEVQDVAALVAEVQAFVNGFDPANLQLSMRFEWAPRLQDWPPGGPTLVAFKETNGVKRNLSLRVEGKVTATGEMHAEAVAEIRDVELRLFGDEPLIVFPIHHMYFKAGASGKPEVDVLLGELEFCNELAFIETIKDLIPFDGFSDPPYVDVDTDGARAGFTLELPNVAIGVFNLSNISLGADVSVPFLGSIVTAGFDFCTREKPFSLTVMCLGGGGWFGMRVSPKGLEILELGLEAQACLAVDFGVASGSISASVGVYIRLEAEKGSLTGYFRLRGEVDVLGLISASIELYLSLTYHTDSGKMVGRAEITIEVEVLCFSGSVKVSTERRLAGSNGDPSFREILGAETTGTSPYWTTYCDAFAGE